jgi:hypothetical protein
LAINRGERGEGEHAVVLLVRFLVRNNGGRQGDILDYNEYSKMFPYAKCLGACILHGN